jgi:hypothetical protein
LTQRENLPKLSVRLQLLSSAYPSHLAIVTSTTAMTTKRRDRAPLLKTQHDLATRVRHAHVHKRQKYWQSKLAPISHQDFVEGY